jgi:hypothetical protein
MAITIKLIPDTPYTETIVDVTSAEILSLGTSAKELLPNPGAGKYYILDMVILEYTFGTTAYALNTNSPIALLWNDTGDELARVSRFFTESTQNAQVVIQIFNVDLASTNEVTKTPSSALILRTSNGFDPTLGNGTLRVKIYHKTITFGA